MGHRNEVPFLQLLLTAFEGGPHSGVQSAFEAVVLLPQALRGGKRDMYHLALFLIIKLPYHLSFPLGAAMFLHLTFTQ